MSQALFLNIPSEASYTASKPSIPNGSTHYDNQLAPTSGSGTYTAGDVFYVDLPSSNFADFKNSLYVRYKYNVVQPAVVNGSSFNIIGTPLYSAFSKIETIINSTTYESVTQTGPVANMFVNSQLNYSQKVGSSNYGWNGTTPLVCNGYQTGIIAAAGATVNLPVSGPIPCVLSACEQLVPMFACPLVRLQFTVAQLADIFNVGASQGSSSVPTLPTSFTISDFRLCYKTVSFGAQVEQYVKQMTPNIMIKSQILQVMTQPLAVFTGQTDLTFNMRNQSVKSLFGLISNGQYCVNRLQDAIDITAGSGTYQFSINSKYYPSYTLNTGINKSQFLSEHKMAISASSGHSIQSANQSITTAEFAFLGTSGSATTAAQMGKFYVSANSESHMSNNYVMSGVSTRDAPIIYSINSSSATSSAGTVILIVLADAMLEIDVASKNAKISS